MLKILFTFTIQRILAVLLLATFSVPLVAFSKEKVAKGATSKPAPRVKSIPAGKAKPQAKVPAKPPVASGRILLNPLPGKAAQQKVQDTTLTIVTKMRATVFDSGIFVGVSNQPIPLEPGKHEISIIADGYRDEKRVVTLKQGQSLKLPVNLVPPPPPPKPKVVPAPQAPKSGVALAARPAKETSPRAGVNYSQPLVAPKKAAFDYSKDLPAPKQQPKSANQTISQAARPQQGPDAGASFLNELKNGPTTPPPQPQRAPAQQPQRTYQQAPQQVAPQVVVPQPQPVPVQPQPVVPQPYAQPYPVYPQQYPAQVYPQPYAQPYAQPYPQPYVQQTYPQPYPAYPPPVVQQPPVIVQQPVVVQQPPQVQATPQQQRAPAKQNSKQVQSAPSYEKPQYAHSNAKQRSSGDVVKQRAKGNPIVALLPFGLGQFQNNEPIKGWIFAGVQVGGLSYAGVNFYLAKTYSGKKASDYDQKELEKFTSDVVLYQKIGFGVFGGFWLIGVVDAFINLDNGSSSPTKTQNADVPQESYKVSLYPQTENSSLGLGLSIKF